MPAALNSRYSVSQLYEIYTFYFTVHKEKFFIALQTEQLKSSSDLLGQGQRLHVSVEILLGLTNVLPEVSFLLKK